MIKKVISLWIVLAVCLSVTAFAKTPIYDENGELEGYSYSESDFDMDKLRKLANGNNVTVSVEIDGELTDFNSAESDFDIITDSNGVDFIPIRFFAEALGYSVEWDNDTRKVTLLRNGMSVILTIDSQFAEKNGERVELFEAARIFDDKTYIPARNLDELIGY